MPFIAPITEKRRGGPINWIRNERGDITADSIENQDFYKNLNVLKVEIQEEMDTIFGLL